MSKKTRAYLIIYGAGFFLAFVIYFLYVKLGLDNPPDYVSIAAFLGVIYLIERFVND